MPLKMILRKKLEKMASFWRSFCREADYYGIGKQKAKQVLKPTQGFGFSCSVSQPARTAKKTCFWHATLDCRHEYLPHRARIMTQLGGRMLH